MAAGVASTGPKNVSVSVAVSNVAGTDKQIWAAAVSRSPGKCFWIKDVATGGLGRDVLRQRSDVHGHRGTRRSCGASW